MPVKSAMRPARGKAFKSWPEAMAIGQPWDPAHFCNFGYPLGMDLRNKSVVLYDPHYMRVNGTTWSPAWELSGQTRYGKSGLQKMLTPRFLGRRAGFDSQGRPIKSRGQMHADKSNPGEAEDTPNESEIEALVDYYKGRMVYLGSEHGLNLFDAYYGDSPVELLDTANIICVESKKAGLSGHEPFVLQVGIFVMIGDTNAPVLDTRLLERIMGGLRYDDGIRYFNSVNNMLLDDLHEELKARPDLRHRLNIKFYPPNITPEEFASAAANIATYLNTFHGGTFGSTFGGQLSPAELFRGRFVGIEWKGVKAPARSLLQTMNWKAMRIQTQPGGDPTLLPHFRFQDEGASAMLNPSYVYARAEFTRTTSEHRVFDLLAAQYWSQLTRIGEPGSALRTKAEEIQKAIGGRIVGKLAPDDDYSEELIRTGVSQDDVDFMRNDFREGCFALLVPNQAPVMLWAYPTVHDWPFLRTNQAVDSMTASAPTPAVSLDKINSQAQEFGVTYVTNNEVYYQPAK